MPEVVEVNFLKEEIASAFQGRRVVEAILNNEKISNVDRKTFEKELKNETLIGTGRHGKVLILKFSDNKFLLIHFLLTGFLRLIDSNEKEKAQAYLAFDNQKSIGIFGIMSNGYVNFHRNKNVEETEEIKELGIDILDKSFDINKFKVILEANKNRTIKDVLLDQNIIAGLGNAYSDEILFQAKIHPKRKIKELTEKEIENIYKSIFEIIEKAQHYGGASELSFVHIDGTKGSFHEHFLVHKREGENCYICGTPIKMIKVGGRSSYFCPYCQR